MAVLCSIVVDFLCMSSVPYQIKNLTINILQESKYTPAQDEYIFTDSLKGKYETRKSALNEIPVAENKTYRTEVSTSPKVYRKNTSKNSGEITHIEFLKVHKAASSTVQNILMRFGLKRNLSFVIPADQHYISKERTYFSDIWPPLPKESADIRDNLGKSDKHDILCNHMVFNRKKISRLLHNDSMYIGIVREPFDQFLSSAIYYKFKYKYPYLRRLPKETFITDLIRNPRQNEATTMAESMTYNSMSYDFGMSIGFSEAAINGSLEVFDEFLNDTANTFHLVMLFEKFDESLVLLRRYLNFTIEDIVYVPGNSFSFKKEANVTLEFNITEDDMAVFRERNQFDYKLYAFFKTRIEMQIARESMFQEEVKHFKAILNEVQEFCAEDDDEKPQKNKTTSAKEAQKPIDMKRERLKTVLKTINSTISNKVMTEKQAIELQKLGKIIQKDYFKWPLKDLISLLPRLFQDKRSKPDPKDEDASLESDLVIPESKWNKEFIVSAADCDLMNMEELALVQKVKSQHIKLTVYRKFGENFSVIEAVKHVLRFY
jgi:hypothetical protein